MGESVFLTIFNFSGDRSLSSSVLAQGNDLPLLQEEDLLLAREEDLLLAQEEALLLVQEPDKEWSPEKLKMVKTHFFPELSRELRGFICYHHWYLRAGLEGPEKSFFKLQNEV